MHAKELATIGEKLAEKAMTLLVRLYPDFDNTGKEDREAACEAMRAKSKSVVDELIDDTKAAPWMAHIAFQSAALALAHEGIKALKAVRK